MKKIITMLVFITLATNTIQAQLESSLNKQDSTEIKGIRSNMLLNLLYSESLFLEMDFKTFPIKKGLLKNVYGSVWGTYGLGGDGEVTDFTVKGFQGGGSIGWQKRYLSNRLEPKATLFWITFPGQTSDASGLHLSFGYDIKKWLSISAGSYGQFDTNYNDDFQTNRIAWENGIIINVSKRFRTVLRTSGDTGGFGLDGQAISRQLLELQYVFPIKGYFTGNIKTQFGYDYRNASLNSGQATFFSLVVGAWFNNSDNFIQ
jgi:hypothetical protein